MPISLCLMDIYFGFQNLLFSFGFIHPKTKNEMQYIFYFYFHTCNEIITSIFILEILAISFSVKTKEIIGVTWANPPWIFQWTTVMRSWRFAAFENSIFEFYFLSIPLSFYFLQCMCYHSDVFFLLHSRWHWFL